MCAATISSLTLFTRCLSISYKGDPIIWSKLFYHNWPGAFPLLTNKSNSNQIVWSKLAHDQAAVANLEYNPIIHDLALQPRAHSAEQAVDIWLDMWVSSYIALMIFSIPSLISETVDLAWYLNAFENLLSRKAAGKHVSRYDNKPVAEWLQITRNLDLPSVQRNFEGIIGYLCNFILFLRRQFWKIYAFFHLSVLCLLLLHCMFLISNNFSFTLTLLLDPETVDQVHSYFLCWNVCSTQAVEPILDLLSVPADERDFLTIHFLPAIRSVKHWLLIQHKICRTKKCLCP